MNRLFEIIPINRKRYVYSWRKDKVPLAIAQLFELSMKYMAKTYRTTRVIIQKPEKRKRKIYLHYGETNHRKSRESLGDFILLLMLIIFYQSQNYVENIMAEFLRCFVKHRALSANNFRLRINSFESYT